MPNPHLPRETLGYIIDPRRDEPETLEEYCLVSELRVPHTRKHMIAEVEFVSSGDIEL